MASSLYGLRRDVVRTLGNLGIPLGLAGADWLESRVQRWNRGSRSLIRATRGRSLALSLGEAYGRVDVNGADYVGPIADKFAFLQQAPISVVVENSLDYVSEKLFDAIRAGVAPVYVGPPLTEFGIPQEIALVADPLATDVVRRVRDTSPSELAKCIQHGQTWISSSEYQSHESNRVLRSLGEEIGKAITLYDGLEEGTIRRIADR